MFLRESDRGVLTRAEATEAVAALTSIATGSSPTLLPAADRAVLELAARDAVLNDIADEIVVGPEAEAGVVGGCVAESCVLEGRGPTRRIVRLAVGPTDVAWIASTFRHQIATAGLADPGVLIGHYLVIGTPSGERVVREYESGVALQDAWINNIAVARAADHLG